MYTGLSTSIAETSRGIVRGQTARWQSEAGSKNGGDKADTRRLDLGVAKFLSATGTNNPYYDIRVEKIF